MRQAVKDAFHKFSEPLEGRVHHLYLDVKCLPTTGVGNLVETLLDVLALPWKRPDGSRAGRNEIVAMYETVLNHKELAPKGGMIFAKLTNLRLTDEDVDELVDQRLEMNHATLLRRMPNIADWPADAELFIHSWAWAVGAAAKYPRMIEALNEKRFDDAARECTINPQIGTIVKRNEWNRRLLSNASRVQAFHFDPDVVYFPRDLLDEVKELPTDPAVENPITEDDGGVARRRATLDTVSHDPPEPEDTSLENDD